MGGGAASQPFQARKLELTKIESQSHN